MEDEIWVGPEWRNIAYLLQPSCLALICTAVVTVMLAAVRALGHEMDIQRSGVSHAEGAVTLDHRQALALPLVSSCALLALFFFFKAIQFLLLLVLSVAGVVAVGFALQPLVEAAAAGRHPWLRRRVSLCSRFPAQVGDVLQGGAGIAILATWIVTGSMALNNVLGICLCITFVSLVRLPNVKVCTFLLLALFVYDCFWVFFSEAIFGKNVMVAAATKQADNPAFLAAEALHLPSAFIAPSLELPVKLLFPARLLSFQPQDAAMMLGLGDMALPGMLLALLLCRDAHAWGVACSGGAAKSSMLRMLLNGLFWRQSYVLPSWVGYAAGIFLALGVGTVYQAAQPALLYLVPCTLLPLWVKASARGEVQMLWEGTPAMLHEDKQPDV